MEVEILALKELEKVMGHSEDALTQRLLQLQEAQLDKMSALRERLLQLREAQLDKMSALDHYTKMQGRALERTNKKIKEKGISKGDLVLC